MYHDIYIYLLHTERNRVSFIESTLSEIIKGITKYQIESISMHAINIEA